MNGDRGRFPRAVLGLGAVLALFLAGCGAETVSVPVAPATATPTTVSTVSVGYAVVVTSVPTPSTVQPTPTTTATRFVAPKGPWLTLDPSFGPPETGTINVHGGNLPHNVQITLLWAAPGHSSSIGTTAYTDGKGRLSSALSIPAAAPGTYLVQAEVNSVPVAHAGYHVVSLARLDAKSVVSPTSEGIQVRGRRFLPNTRAALIVYPVQGSGKPILLGVATSDSTGAFTYFKGLKLKPGQYVLRAWTVSAITAQMAQTFFQVEI